MMRTPDGHGRVELPKFHTPTAVSTEPENAPPNTLGKVEGRRACRESCRAWTLEDIKA
jgi:hypothetical protein